jgi:hypothetical protein
MPDCLLGESGDIFFPKLKPDSMKRFADISNLLLKELDLIPIYCSSEEEAKIAAANRNRQSSSYPVLYFKSDTTGEKPFEEFYSKIDNPDFNSFKSLGVVKNTCKITVSQVEQQLEELNSLIESTETTKTDLIAFFQQCVPEFHHMETGHYLDDKM